MWERKFAAVSLALCLFTLFLSAQELASRPASTAPKIAPAAGKTPNSHAMYQQLRNATTSGEMSAANNLTLKRDAGTFTFASGTFYFLTPVNGKVTGAVFVGEGSFALEPPIASEKQLLALLTKEPTFHETFHTAVFRFTDDTYGEIKKAAGVSTGSPGGGGELNDINRALKKKLNFNLTGRLLDDVMSTEPGGAFFAFINGRKYNGKEIFAVDPHGALGMEPEEVAFQTWDESKFGTWAAFHFSNEYKTGDASGTQQNAMIDIQNHVLDTQLEKSGKLSGDATTTFMSLKNGLQVVPFNLFPTLRVSSVTGENGDALDFIQESKDDDPDFYVVLPKALAVGETYTIRTVYAGKDAISNEGAGNYYPIARSTWYPNTGLNDYAKYELRFRIPKNFKIAATGQKEKEAVEGDWNVSEWKSRTYQSVAGFNYGDFKTETKKIDGLDFDVETYANPNLPDWLKSAQFSESMSPPSMMKKAMAEAQIAIPLYTKYFGPTSFKHIAMTQQTAGNYGQAWPELIYMPLTSFLDSTHRFTLMGFDPKGYFTVVGPHEIAHQWWGHTIGWGSYRDQWMSEGFSEFSASLFLQTTRDNKQFIKFWNDELEEMTQKNREGYRAIDVGPLTMGYRLNNSKAGFDITRNLIYPKGGYVLHMIRMMMWQARGGDDKFIEMMQDFVKAYTNRPASTEDFKAIVEKHMLPGMDLDGNRRMDWFFNPYVYGTVLPSYKFEHTIENGPNGGVLNFKITQAKVPENFKMPVPVYVELMDGRVTKLGAANMLGNTTVQQSVPLGQTKVKRAMLSYYNDVLGTIEK